MSKKESDSFDEENIDKNGDGDDQDTELDKEIYVVPTSHASEKSKKDVIRAIKSVDPDIVGLELDSQRIQRFENDQIQKASEKSVWSIIKNTKGIGLKGRLFLVLFSVVQSKVASNIGADILGIDMKTGYDESKKRGIPIALVDKDIRDTFNNLTDQISKTELLKTFVGFFIAYIQITLFSSKVEDMQDDITESDIDSIMDKMDNHFPTVKKILIDDRNEYIAQNMINIGKNKNRSLVIIGAGHQRGVEDIIQESDEVVLKNVFERDEFLDNK